MHYNVWTLLCIHYNTTGTTLVTAVASGRHCVSVENNSLQFIWAKVRAVKAINQPGTTEDETNGEEMDKDNHSDEPKNNDELGNKQNDA